MKYVYILVDSSEGFYFEQTLASLASLKYVCPSAKVTLLTDNRTDCIDDSLLPQIHRYVDEYIVREFDENISSIARSRILKTTMRSLVEGDFLYVDSDTVWAAPVDESDFTDDVMGVLDGHCLLNEHPLKNGILQDFEKTGCNPSTEFYINGGVLFVKDSEKARKFFEVWHGKWLETSKFGCYIDMPSLNYAFKQLYGGVVPLLSGNYNSQISRSWKFFAKAKVVHFFTGWMKETGEKIFLFQRKEFWERVKKIGIDDYVMSALKNPLEAFVGTPQIFDSFDAPLRKTASYGLLCDMYERKMTGKKSRFDFVEKIVKFLAGR